MIKNMTNPEECRKILTLKPSDVYFSQDTITQYFNRTCIHPFKPIGETLDALCNGECDVKTIPNITVARREGKWFTENNRRLWLYKKLALIGKLETINAVEVPDIDPKKWTTCNGGLSVEMIGIPGGIWWLKIARMFPDVVIESKLLPPDYTVMPEDYSVVPQSLQELQSLGTDVSSFENQIAQETIINSKLTITSNDIVY